ncbi:MAG: lipopolysaccharide transport periplasmic protein LptA [Pseudomonadota bacterium]
MCLANKGITALAVSMALSGAAFAQGSSKKTPQRVSGPITITAKTGEWQDGNMIYTGDVVMISKTLELRGARLELQQGGGKKSPYIITVTGAPATLKHMGQTAQDPVVNGRSKTMIYRSATQNIQLTGDAHLERAKDELNGDDIKYDVASRRVQATGGDKGQVRIVIDVPEQDQ